MVRTLLLWLEQQECWFIKLATCLNVGRQCDFDARSVGVVFKCVSILCVCVCVSDLACHSFDLVDDGVDEEPKNTWRKTVHPLISWGSNQRQSVTRLISKANSVNGGVKTVILVQQAFQLKIFPSIGSSRVFPVKLSCKLGLMLFKSRSIAWRQQMSHFPWQNSKQGWQQRHSRAMAALY